MVTFLENKLFSFHCVLRMYTLRLTYFLIYLLTYYLLTHALAYLLADYSTFMP